MSRRSSAVSGFSFLLLASLLWTVTAVAPPVALSATRLEARPVAVSPGLAGDFAPASGSCPTFSWGEAQGALGYRVLVWRLAADGSPESEAAALSADLPAGVSSWTPPGVECLARGARYAWTVRALGAEFGEERGSEPRFFALAAKPTEDEFQAALAVVRSYLEVGGGNPGAAPAGDAAAAESAPRTGTPSGASPGRGAGSPTPQISTTTELKVAGGIEAVAFTGDGSGLTSVDADLLDGLDSADLAPALHLHDGADVATGTVAEARIDGAIARDVEILPVVLAGDGSGSGLDADLLDGIDSPVLLTHDRGSLNTGAGVDALAALTTGARNTAFGEEALMSTTTGSFNNAIGSDALLSNVSGNANLAVGVNALRLNTASYNVALGNGALEFNTGGHNNSAVGRSALRYNTTGIRNTASGAFALNKNTTGIRNTASGAYALHNNTTGSTNAASGANALHSNTTGAYNTASGAFALNQNTTGNRNTASGVLALHSNTTGARNTGLGYRAGYYASTGSDNIFLGSGAEGAAAEGNTIRIGGTAVGTGSKQQNRTFINGIRGVTTANANAVAVVIDSAGQLGTVSSSARTKEEIHDMADSSARLLALRPVTFRYKKEFADGAKPIQFGLIAEEVAEVFPELVVYDAEGRPETVQYHLLASLLLNELQKQETLNLEQARSLAVQTRVNQEQASELGLLARANQEQAYVNQEQAGTLVAQARQLTELAALKERLAELEDVKARLVQLEATVPRPPRVAAVAGRARSSPDAGR